MTSFEDTLAGRIEKDTKELDQLIDELQRTPRWKWLWRGSLRYEIDIRFARIEIFRTLYEEFIKND